MDEMALIPTAGKSPISKLTSFVLGAEALSEAFRGIPQYDLFLLEFHSAQPPHVNSPGKRLVLRVDYSPRSPSIASQRGFPGDWYLRVYAVPRNLKAQIKKALLEDVLPSQMLPWLRDSGGLDGRAGSLMTDVFFDPGTQECYVQHYHGGLQPQRVP
ncbi:hypothetical protein [Taklimakanibacter albus]|uniref:Uncharacterized protein n=1 Tax=Taklimakanibacter albus TaxID=2800327 RepID=A0ACC5R9M6_9HYPH|nr:hypothetical protein [Aestuariivirga sp. YIM B02566]MBK1869334.1 hypothetical protein [Aestuariivirga sp. YIM B02566]